MHKSTGASGQAGRQTDKERPTDRETNRQTNNQTSRQTEKRTRQHAILVVGSEGGSREDCNLLKHTVLLPRCHEQLDLEIKEIGSRCPEPMSSCV